MPSARPRDLNKRLILRTIARHQPISRADVAKRTGLTRPTISNIVADWLDAGLVQELGAQVSQGGKPGILLGIVADARWVLAVTAADNLLVAGLVNLQGEVRHLQTWALQDDQDALPQLLALLDSLMPMAPGPVLGLGAAITGVVDSHQGVVHRAVYLDWEDVPLARILARRYELPVHVVNDSAAAALGAYAFDTNIQAENLAVIRIGQGIGAGLILNGKLHLGESFGAGEIGHWVVVENGEPCRCGRFGCLETVASAAAILRQARAIYHARPESAFHHHFPNAAAISLAGLAHLAQAGNPDARGIIANAGRHLGNILAALVGILDVGHIQLSGEVEALGEPLLAPVRQAIHQKTLPMLARNLTLSFSTLGESITLLGAAVPIIQQELGI
jgi:predicted NBD/HSP70 family sugar kinase